MPMPTSHAIAIYFAKSYAFVSFTSHLTQKERKKNPHFHFFCYLFPTHIIKPIFLINIAPLSMKFYFVT